MTETPLFENRRYCEECHCLLPTSYEGTLCPRCLEQELFHQVKEYIQTKEKMLADYEDEAAWSRKALVNIAKAGYFSADRTIAEYNRDIWKLS